MAHLFSKEMPSVLKRKFLFVKHGASMVATQNFGKLLAANQ